MVASRTQLSTLDGRVVFLSASIPDQETWDGPFEPLEVTDAVVSAVQEVLSSGGRLVMAAHPTISSLVLYVASDLVRVLDSGDAQAQDPLVIVYQCDLFEDSLPAATRRFEEEGVGVIRWTRQRPGDSPEPGRRDASLAAMREEMLTCTDPAGAIFIGGMEGIDEEYRLFGKLYPERPRYPVGRPGGVARRLSAEAESRVEGLATEDVYPALFRRVVADLIDHLPD